MANRYILRLPDGDDAGEAEFMETPAAGEVIRVSGNRRMRVRKVVPIEVVEEFVSRPAYGFLEVEPAD